MHGAGRVKFNCIEELTQKTKSKTDRTSKYHCDLQHPKSIQKINNSKKSIFLCYRTTGYPFQAWILRL